MSTRLAAVADSAPAILREATAVLRLALFLRVDGREIVGRESTILLLTGIALAVWVVNSSLQMLFGVLSVYALFYFARGLRLVTGHHQPVALVVGGLTKERTSRIIPSLPQASFGELIEARLEKQVLAAR